MELRHLRYLVAVAEQGSFTRAARILNVSQSAISEQLADLERQMGVSLLVRSPRKTILTKPGELFLEEAYRILAAANHAIEVAQRADRGEVGTLRIGFFAGGIGVNFPRLIRDFRKLHRGVQLSLIEMTSTQQWPALIEGRIDVGFTRRIEPEFRAELHSEVISKTP
jgi:DNA-binding transcriptional LysR family regulator